MLARFFWDFRSRYRVSADKTEFNKDNFPNNIKKSFNLAYTVLVRQSRRYQNPHMHASTHMSDVVQAPAAVAAASTVAFADRAFVAIREATVPPA